MLPLKLSRLLLILSVAGTCAQHINAQTPGVECGCDVEDGPSYQEGTSPGGKYTEEATPATYPNISIS